VRRELGDPQPHEGKAMDSNKKLARTAGLLYLIVVVGSLFSYLYVPSQTTVRGDALATANSILASESLFRLGIVTGLVNITAFLLLPFVLYKLLQKVNRDVAVLMVVLAVVSTPISLVSMRNRLDVLSLLSGADFLHAYTTEQLHTQVMLSLKASGNGFLVAELFWGLWLLPFGYLVFKSGFLPRILGILLMIGCFGYLIDVFGHLLFPAYTEAGVSSYVMLLGIGEITICLWLLIMGARSPSRSVV
jgi:Domain of unknown function (DUF4386)